MNKVKKRIVVIIMLVEATLISGCRPPFSIVGMWKDTDETIRTFNENGICKNIEKGDIGGPAPVYDISSKEDDGYYFLSVSQSNMNHKILYVKVVNNDHIEISESKGGSILYDLERQ